jgi:hypothetical protein
MAEKYQDDVVAVWSGSLQVAQKIGSADWCYVSRLSVGEEEIDFGVVVSMVVWREFESALKGTSKNWRDTLCECLTQYVEEKLEGGSWKPSRSGQEFRADNEKLLELLKEEIA